jgi:hypothetical protein
MDFYAVLDQVLDLLRQRGRVTYNALKRQFGLDDARLQDLRDEIIEAQLLAVDEDGRVLAWTGGVAAPSPPATAPYPDAVQTEAYYRQVLARAEELGMRPLVVHCHLGLGWLYGQHGRCEAARAALTTAVDPYRAMSMTFWLPQAAAALAQVVDK